MTTVEQIERIIEQLPMAEFEKLSAWMEEQRRVHSTRISNQHSSGEALVLRDHQAFLNSYAPEDEGLYDDAEAR